jgi:hypothetical protein
VNFVKEEEEIKNILLKKWENHVNTSFTFSYL